MNRNELISTILQSFSRPIGKMRALLRCGKACALSRLVLRCSVVYANWTTENERRVELQVDTPNWQSVLPASVFDSEMRQLEQSPSTVARLGIGYQSLLPRKLGN